MMKQIVYVSFLSDGHKSEDVIPKIKEVAERKNKTYGITGCLIYSKTVFVQLLEGEDINVDIAYRIIQDDPRHFQAKIIFEQTIEKRSFSEWSMKFNSVDEIDLMTVNKVLDFKNKLSKNKEISPIEVKAIFDNLIKQFS